MSQSVNLSRNTKLLVSTVTSGHTTANTFEIPILNGYSFTQNTETQNVTLNEAGAAPARGQRVFNTALNPVDISFTTYVRPYAKTGPLHTCVERVLWDALAGHSLDGATDPTSTKMTVDFASSNAHELLPLVFYFKVDNQTYMITGATITSVTIDFSIDGIASLQWSAQGRTLAESAFPSTYLAATPAGLGTIGGAEPDFIKNKLSVLSVIAADTDKFPGANDNGVYNIAITGGSLTIDNGITFLTPEELGVVNKPIGSFTGTRAISGNVTCYLRTGVATGQSGDLFTDLATNTDVVTNEFALIVKLGGASAPRIELKMPKAHLQIPTTNIEDVVAMDIGFTALGTTIEETDEITVDYYAYTAP